MVVEVGHGRERRPARTHLVLGMAKTGTSALFESIRRQLPDETEIFFEPSRPSDWAALKTATGVVLAKALLRPYLQSGIGAALFDRVVILVRDPRDQLLSRLLYWAAQFSKHNQDARPAVLEALARKERNPDTVGFFELFDTIAALDGHSSFFPRPYLPEFADRLADAIQTFPAIGHGHLCKYEDLVDGRITDLRAYLGLEIEAAVTLPPALIRVERSRGHGEWKEWFLPGDLERLRPVIGPYMARFGYADTPPNTNRHINTGTASEFVVKSWGLA